MIILIRSTKSKDVKFFQEVSFWRTGSRCRDNQGFETVQPSLQGSLHSQHSYRIAKEYIRDKRG